MLGSFSKGNKMKYNKIMLLLGLSLILTLGCQARNRGPLEKAGERTDEVIDNVQEGRNPLHKKGAMEKAGEAIDETISGKRK